MALSISTEAAEALLERSLTLVHRLPLTLDAREAGALHVGHLWPLLDEVAPIADDALRAALEADLPAWTAGRVTTPAQLGDEVRREVLKRDARSAADRPARSIGERGVSAQPDRTEGMSVMSALLTTPEAAALVAALGAHADALHADLADERTRGQKTADCLLDLVLRPGETGLPSVQVVLSVVAPLGALLDGDQPCEVDGQVVPAEMVRALLTALTGHPLVTAVPADASTDAAPTDDVPAKDVLTEDEYVARWAEDLERRIRAGEFDDRPAPCFPDEPPPDLGAHDSGSPPHGFAGSPPRSAPPGLEPAPGWRHVLAPDGTLTVTTPTGLTAATTPPPYGTEPSTARRPRRPATDRVVDVTRRLPDPIR